MRPLALLALAILTTACNEDRLRVVFAGWSPAFQSVDLYADGARFARLNKATRCVDRVGAWCADHVRSKFVVGRTYTFTVVGIDRYGTRYPSNPVAYTHEARP